MLTATKKLTRVGSYSQGVVIPREWLDATGASTYNLEYEERTRVITMIPVDPRAKYDYNAANDYTPQPRQVYPPSPHPAFTPAKWAKIEEHNKPFLLAQLREAQKTQKEEEAQKRLPYGGVFEGASQKVMDFYWREVAPYIDDYEDNDTPSPLIVSARKSWMSGMRHALSLPPDTDEDIRRLSYIRNTTEYVTRKYAPNASEAERNM